MSATTAPYRSSLPVGRDGFAELLHAEWTKFRTVRGWVITAFLAALLIVLFAYLGTFRHQDGGICVGTNPASPDLPELRPPHTAARTRAARRSPTPTTSCTERLRVTAASPCASSSLSGRVQGGNGNAVSVADLAGASGSVQPWAKAGLILTATTKPGSAYAAVMLTGAHGVRMQSDYTARHRRPGRVRRRAALAALDPLGHNA